jgi:ABC-type glycerol-3-phosphate transport system substrate-binding protein
MKDFAALYCMWLTSPEKSAVAVSAKGSWMDPCRYNHAGESADPRVLEARGVIIPPFLKNASIAVPVVGSGIRGGNEYATTLSRNVHAAMQGTMDATESMERTAEEWDEITDRIGREKQIDAWRAYMKFYPTAIV